MLFNIYDNCDLFLLLLVRMSGAVLLNPLFGRRNVPNLVKAGLTFALAAVLTVYSASSVPAFRISSILEFFYMALMEFMVGYVVSFVCSVFFSAVIVAADVIDMQLGIGMAKAFDPGSNITAPVTGSIFNGFMVIIFFATNGHITLFKLLADTVAAVPCGSGFTVSGAALAVTGVIGSAFTIALKLALPVIAIELIFELGLGVLTRVVPHINIFSVGIQLKLAAGFTVLLIMAPVFGSFCDELYSLMFGNILKALRHIK